MIFRKYSLMGGLNEFAGQLCSTLNRTTGHITVITDRDSCVAVAGVQKKDVMEKPISAELERLMEGRQVYQYRPGNDRISLCSDDKRYHINTAAPIISEGDVLGCVVFTSEEEQESGEVEYKLAQSIAGFLGKHMET